MREDRAEARAGKSTVGSFQIAPSTRSPRARQGVGVWRLVDVDGFPALITYPRPLAAHHPHSSGGLTSVASFFQSRISFTNSHSYRAF